MQAQSFILKLLQLDPSSRATIDQVLADQFLQNRISDSVLYNSQPRLMALKQVIKDLVA